MGFDSEADRRDAVRMKIVNDCYNAVLKIISDNAVTYTPRERSYLQVAVAERILKGVLLEAQAMLWGEEIKAAEAKLDE